MASLGSHANVWHTCLQLLHTKGFRVWVRPSPEDDGDDDWFAERDGFDFQADNPIELLGLAAIYEHVRPAEQRSYWWSVDGDGPTSEQLMDEALERRAAREEELLSLREHDPAEWVSLIEKALDNSSGSADTALWLGISTRELASLLEDPLLDGIEPPS